MSNPRDSDVDLPGSSQDEIQKIKIMRALIEHENPSAKEVDDMTLRRFLRARDHDIPKASTMFLNYLTWRRSFIPRDGISKEDIRNKLAMNNIFLQGFDKLGRPIVVAIGARNIPVKNNDDVEELKKYIVYAMEKACSRTQKDDDKLVLIADLKGWRFSNLDMKGHHAVAPIVEQYYPERMGKVFIVHAPSIFSFAWKLVQPIVDQNTKKKIVFVESKKLKPTLIADIDESQLPDIYGGKLPLVPIQDS
ncbi:Phosphatidylinositol transfer protein 3-like protein [Drosera capensis]